MKTIVKKSLMLSLAIAFLGTTAAAHAANSVKGANQDVSEGTVTAAMIESDANGWLVVHRTNKDMKPGPVVGYAPVKKGMNQDVVAILMEPVDTGEMLMLMLHGEQGGMKTGVFEYTLGAKEDGPIREDGKLVMDIITAE